ncbi:MAG: DUF2249 domain-containing protein [Aquificaceae bacterium]
MLSMLELEKVTNIGNISVRSLEKTLMPSSIGYDRLYIISEGFGRYIIGKKFGNIKAPAVSYVSKGELFGFMPEGKGVIYEIALGKEDEQEGPTVDLRPMEHGHRHPLVIEKFSSLEKGEGFFIINDHDPLPLYFQMSMFFPKKVGWEYVAYEGDLWKVRIRRL